MCAQVRYKSFDQLSFTDLLVYSKLPSHFFWSHVEEQIDFSFADRLCAVLYSGRGQHPYAPSLKLKIHLVQAYYVLSDRMVEHKVIADLFIKRFLGLPVEFFGFDHSTIGLDRSRMGEAMFHACHLYILAQLYSKGLWGDKNEQWIIDSFPSDIHMVRCGAYRLIQKAMIRVVQHLKRHAPSSVRDLAAQSVPLDAMMVRSTADSTPADRMLAFSKLVAQAYGLLQWFQHDDIVPLLAEWKTYAKSQELQAILHRILTENSRPHDPNNEKEAAATEPTSDSEVPGQTSTLGSDEGPTAQAQEAASEVLYEKTPRKKRPSDRVVSVVDPEARTGVKNKSTVIVGYKIQNLSTSGGVILDARVVPANEHDQEAMAGMVTTIQDLFHTTPQALLGDTAYGHGKQRVALASQGVRIVAPVPESTNPKNLFTIASFTYVPEKDAFICPNGAQTKRKSVNPGLNGTQYYFPKKDCADCPLRAQCTTNAQGRTVFRSDYADIYTEAKAFNESDAGREALSERCIVERKNNELKNDCGLGQPNTRSRKALQMKAWLAVIVVNLKHMVRVKVNPKPGFLRRTQTA